MAVPIYVHTKNLMISDAKKASSCIEEAISAMSKVDNAVSGWDLYIDAAADGFVFAKSESEVGACLSVLRTKQTQLEKLISVMQTGTEKLEEADAGFKNDLDQSDFLDRLRALLFGTVTPSHFWLHKLFEDRKDNSSTIDVDPIVNEEPPKPSAGEEYSIRIKSLLEQAKNEKGNDGTKYWQWYTERERLGYYWQEGWCAAFVSYWMENAGIDVDAPRKNHQWYLTYPPHQVDFFKSQGLFYDGMSDYIPKTGDLVFLDWDGDVTNAAHVGMIYVDDTTGKTYIVHGNTGGYGVVSVDEYTSWYRGRTVGFGDVAGYADASS